MSAWFALALLIASCITLLLRHDVPTIFGYNSEIVAAGVAIIALLVYILSAFIRDNIRLMSLIIHNAIVVVILCCIIFLGYQFRSELLLVAHHVGNQVQNVQGFQITSRSNEGRETVVRIRKRFDGHFVARTKVNTVPLDLIVDTGATVVVLKPSDALLVGIRVNNLKYDVPVQTANGVAYAARVRLRKVAVGPLAAYKVEAFVVREGTLRRSLLGLSFLNRLRSYEVSGDYLSLRG